jgi:ClpP class serine protease
MVAGLWDLMPALAQIREKKPVTAIANAFCASAATDDKPTTSAAATNIPRIMRKPSLMAAHAAASQ